MVLICSLRIEASDSTKMKESWIDDMEEYPIIDELEADARLGKLRERAVSVCEQRTLAAPGNVAVGTGGQAIGGSVTAHTPTLSKMPKSCDTDSQKYRKMMGWLQEEPKNLVPSALGAVKQGSKRSVLALSYPDYQEQKLVESLRKMKAKR